MCKESFFIFIVFSILIHACLFLIADPYQASEITFKEGKSSAMYYLEPLMEEERKSVDKDREYVIKENRSFNGLKKKEKKDFTLEERAKKRRDLDGDLEIKGVKANAKIEGNTKPHYPRYSRLKNEEGTVILSLTIMPNGRCQNIKIVKSSGFWRLDNAAIKAVKKSKFVAATKFGRRVSEKKQIIFSFILEG